MNATTEATHRVSVHRIERWIDVRCATAAIILALASVALGLFAKTYDTFPGDELVNATVRHLGDGYEPVAYPFNELEVPIAAAIVAVVVVGLVAHRQFAAIGMVSMVMVLHPLLDALKPLVDRPRPSGDFPIRDVVSDSSFPSGHVMTAATAAALLIVFADQVLPRRAVQPVRGAAVIVILLTGAARMWAGVHWFSDTWGALFWSLTIVASVVALRPTFEAVERSIRGMPSFSEERGKEPITKYPVQPARIDRDQLRSRTRAKYSDVAARPELGYHFHTGRPLAALLGYSKADIDWLPRANVESFAGTGHPLSVGALPEGATVLDVGCGAGVDTLLAARQVGPAGRVIAVDMTPEMLEKTRAGAEALGLKNVDSRLGYAEELPVGDGEVDVVISNGAINLTPDKVATMTEIHRVLKPSGRIQIADIVVHREVPEDAKEDIDLWSG